MPIASRMARTSMSGAMSGAASACAAIWRAISASVIASTRVQSVFFKASRAALLDFFAISLYLARIGLAQRNDAPPAVAIDVNANKQPFVNEPECDLPRLSIVEA